MKSIAHNVGLSWLSQLLYVFSQAVRVIFLYRLLETGGRGTWFLMISVLGFAAFFELGFTAAFSRFYARGFGSAEADGGSFLETKKIQYFSFEKLASNAKVLFTGLGVIGFLLSFVIGLVYLHSVSTFKLFPGGVTLAWFLLSLSQGILFVGYQYSAVLQGRGYPGMDAIIKSGVIFVSLLLLIPAFFIRSSLVYLSLVEVLKAVMTLFILRTVCLQRIKAYFSVPFSFDRSTFFVLFRSSIFPTLTGLGAAFALNTDPMYIASWLDVREVSDYYNAHQFISQLFTFCIVLTSSSFPALLSVFAQGNPQAYRQLYFKVLKYSILIYGLLGGYVLFSGQTILQLWLGRGHAVSFIVLALLLIFSFLEMQASIFGNAQFTVEKYPLLWAYWISAGIRYPISIILMMKFGLSGVVAAKIIAQALTVDWLSAYFCLKVVGSWPLDLKRLRSGFALYVPLFVFVVFGLVTRIPSNSLILKLLLQSLGYFALALPAFYFFSDKDFREKMFLRLKERFMMPVGVP